MAVYNPNITVTEVAEALKISRVTAAKWLSELREEQVRELDKDTWKRELWRLEQLGTEYIKQLSYLHADLNHLWDKYPHVILGLIKSQWQIQKEIYELKLSLYSQGKSPTTVNSINISNLVGVKNTTGNNS